MRDVRSPAFADPTLAATDCVVLIDHTATGDTTTVITGDTRHPIPRDRQDAEKVVRL